ncbi:hypothetical protein ACCQ00_21240 [Xanthomonas sp. NCPPB 3761]|uniref:hypothetical protein n=1 Tax=Xanthomonas sp. NCPPB 3761 TaxID=487559 RepID=UPI0035561F8E
MPNSITQYRKENGKHINWIDEQLGCQRLQERRIHQLAIQPGSHASNKDRQQIAHSIVHLLSILTSVQNTSAGLVMEPGKPSNAAEFDKIIKYNNFYSGEIHKNFIGSKTQGNFENTSCSIISKENKNELPEKRMKLPKKFICSTTLSPIQSLEQKNSVFDDHNKYAFPSMIQEALNSVINKLYKTGDFIHLIDPLKFPVASAASLRFRETMLPLNVNTTKKNSLLSSVIHQLVLNGQLSENDGQNMLQLLESDPTMPLPLTFKRLTDETIERHEKRALRADLDPQTAYHIKQHCASEEQVLNMRGRNSDMRLLFEAQRLENPLRRFYDDSDEEPSATVKNIVDALNLFLNLGSFGIKPLVENLLANKKRVEYYEKKGDAICAERFRRINVAELLTGIDISALPYSTRHQSARVSRIGRPGIRLETDNGIQDREINIKDISSKGKQKKTIDHVEENKQTKVLPKNKHSELVSGHSSSSVIRFPDISVSLTSRNEKAEEAINAYFLKHMQEHSLLMAESIAFIDRDAKSDIYFYGKIKKIFKGDYFVFSSGLKINDHDTTAIKNSKLMIRDHVQYAKYSLLKSKSIYRFAKEKIAPAATQKGEILKNYLSRYFKRTLDITNENLLASVIERFGEVATRCLRFQRRIIQRDFKNFWFASTLGDLDRNAEGHEFFTLLDADRIKDMPLMESYYAKRIQDSVIATFPEALYGVNPEHSVLYRRYPAAHAGQSLLHEYTHISSSTRDLIYNDRMYDGQAKNAKDMMRGFYDDLQGGFASQSMVDFTQSYCAAYGKPSPRTIYDLFKEDEIFRSLTVMSNAASYETFFRDISMLLSYDFDIRMLPFITEVNVEEINAVELQNEISAIENM